MSSTELASLVSRLENVTTRLESVAARESSGGGVGGGDDVVAPFVQAYDDIVRGPFANFMQLSGKIGSDVKTIAEMLNQAFTVQRQFLITASKSQLPPQNILQQLLQPTSDQIQAIQSYREKNRASSFFNHLSAISESVPALGWVAVSPTPGPYVKEMVDASQFYTNRVLMDYKEKDKNHVDWVKAWIQTLSELQMYVKHNHTTGLAWNPKGKPAAAGGAGGPPPPPGPPPPLPDFDLMSLSDPAGDNRAALFMELNRGEDVTKGLKKVTTDQQTHKNPTLRTQGPAPYKAPAPGPRPFKSVSATNGPPAQKPPKMELVGKKWIVEHYRDNNNLLVENAEMNQAVYAFDCVNCTIQVKGKINSITLDACKKTAVVFDDVVASVEFVNCQRVQVQTLGKVPTILIDKTDGVQMYLSPQSLDVEVVSSKSSEMNILIPKDGDYVEFPVPEQFKTKWNGRSLHTVVVESA